MSETFARGVGTTQAWLLCYILFKLMSIKAEIIQQVGVLRPAC
jgi:hypothetical protein